MFFLHFDWAPSLSGSVFFFFKVWNTDPGRDRNVKLPNQCASTGPGYVHNPTSKLPEPWCWTAVPGDGSNAVTSASERLEGEHRRVPSLSSLWPTSLHRNAAENYRLIVLHGHWLNCVNDVSKARGRAAAISQDSINWPFHPAGIL